MRPFDRLRPPSPLDPSAAGYKDWLHMNILHPPTGSVGLINVSLHGAPWDPRSRAIGTVLVHLPDVGWIGAMEIRALSGAALDAIGIGVERIALAVHFTPGAVLASVRDPGSGIVMRLTATPLAAPIVVEQPLPLGRGWISWFAVPRLALAGTCTVAHRHLALRGAGAYYDHNWGRWHWGDDMGWEWGCFLTRAQDTAIVLSRTTDRAHRRGSPLSLVVTSGGRRRVFTGPAVNMECAGALGPVDRRLPGALAAMWQDRLHPRLPEHIRIRADNGVDRVTVEFRGRSAAQLIAGDPVRNGYTFIHEIAGNFTCNGRLGDAEIAGAGLAIVEYVD